ncbi:phosphatase PAP2 family protein [Paenibacillus montanisoli]|uniref:Phosphatase PAP2 family protein n=1 Tax=Paenibacillus montanisoli TaxID=2081970 RepID=A0A328U384_9BACL|nr:phosphatase PAP2 family protein [Paenibacillus montanisoli]RAP77110.1 phosphatase PAP2 family protein [Paenibacillus montanisoli]
MVNVVFWVLTHEQRLLLWANRRSPHRVVNRMLSGWLGTVTHAGGATFTLLTSLLSGLLAAGAWSTAGWQGFAATIISHIPVAIMKRKFSRLRPYQALTCVHVCKKPLRDSSFPSGHTTAIFAWLLPWLLAADAALLPVMLPAALLLGGSVAWSRMYLGLHYPSDVAIGAAIGSLVSLFVASAWSFF